tara:strand:+ start:36 stop:725 length:690 start_codon:yes stop_codon:yes gene_type:complete
MQPVDSIAVQIDGMRKVFAVKKLKNMYPNLANRLASGEINLRTFKNLSRKKVNRELGGGKVQAQDRALKAKGFAENPEKYRKSWRESKLKGGRGAASSAMYRANVLQATPPWVLNNPTMMNAIKGMYRTASLMNLNQFLPGRFEVNHIVPIDKGGLNVPWNLEVTDRHTNRSLSSKMPAQDRLTATPAEVKGTARSRGGIPYNPKLLNTQGQFLPTGTVFGRQLKKRKY